MRVGDQGGDFIIARLNKNGYKAYYVGGCVRDSLLGLPLSDYDLTTDCLPEKIVEIFLDKKVFTVGIKHGTVSILIDDKIYEVTTFRSDGDYLDNRHPSRVDFCTNLLSDLSRRDFCCNALAYNKNEGLIDYFNGFYDIENKILRAVGNPKLRFEEDALRILRAIRFCSKLGFSLEEKTETALFSCYELLKNISCERIYFELKGILLGENCCEALIKFKPIICYILRSVAKLSSEQYNSCANVIGKCSNLNTKLTALFLYLDETDVKESLQSLKCDNNTLKQVLRLHEVKNFSANDRFEVKRLMNKFNGDLSLYFELQEAMCFAGCNCQEMQYIETMKSIYLDILKKDECFQLKQLAVNGSDISSYCKGVEIGIFLNKLLESVMREEIKNERAELIGYLKKIL